MKAVLILVLLLCPTLSIAETMSIDADRFELFETEKRADFFGHVVVNRGSMTLKANQMRVWYLEEAGKNKLKYLSAEGEVWISTSESTGSADKATFSPASALLVLTGQAKVNNEQGILEGEKIEYNMDTQEIRVLKGKHGGQVHFTFEEAVDE